MPREVPRKGVSGLGAGPCCSACGSLFAQPLSLNRGSMKQDAVDQVEISSPCTVPWLSSIPVAVITAVDAGAAEADRGPTT